MKTLILGAGYAGLAVATQMQPVEGLETLLIERDAHHTFYTRLHEAAAHNTRVTVDILPLLRGKGVEFEQAEVEFVNADAKEVQLKDGRTLVYDKLVVALGSETNFYRIPGLAENAAQLKTVQDAEGIYKYVQSVYDSSYQGNRDMVIGGAGLTGVELITELAERVAHLSKETGLAPINLYLVEAGPKILPPVDDSLRARAQAVLEEYGIHVLTGHKLMKASAEGVTVQTTTGEEKEIKAGKVVWTGGIMARDLIRGEKLEKGPGGRIPVDAMLRSKAYPDMFVLGDMALATNEEGKPVPTTAQHAGQQGRHTGQNLLRLARGEALTAYKPYTQGEFVSLGGLHAVGWVKLPANKKLALTGGPAFVMKKATEAKWRMSLEVPGLFKE